MTKDKLIQGDGDLILELFRMLLKYERKKGKFTRFKEIIVPLPPPEEEEGPIQDGSAEQG